LIDWPTRYRSSYGVRATGTGELGPNVARVVLEFAAIGFPDMARGGRCLCRFGERWKSEGRCVRDSDGWLALRLETEQQLLATPQPQLQPQPRSLASAPICEAASVGDKSHRDLIRDPPHKGY